MKHFLEKITILQSFIGSENLAMIFRFTLYTSDKYTLFSKMQWLFSFFRLEIPCLCSLLQTYLSKNTCSLKSWQPLYLWMIYVYWFLIFIGTFLTTVNNFIVSVNIGCLYFATFLMTSHITASHGVSFKRRPY